MSQPQSIPPKPTAIKPAHWIILSIILAVAGICRFHAIDRQSLWLDEFWSVYKSAARPETIFTLPRGVLMPPPPIGVAGAPSWPHIWSRLTLDTHPPFYYIALRWWEDIFGDSDLATRSFSATLSLAGILVLFDVCRRLHGPPIALAAAALMAMAPLQIDYSQETRSYTLVLFELLACADLLIIIQHRGPALHRLIALSLAFAATLMTHYLAAFALLGLGIYALLATPRPARTKTLAAIFIALAAVALAWGHFLWQQRRAADPPWLFTDLQGGWRQILLKILILPSQQLFAARQWTLASISIAILVYVIPPFAARTQPRLLLWWLWLICFIIPIACIDLFHHTNIILYPRYALLVAPPIFALILASLSRPQALRNALVAIILFGSMISLVDRMQQGPTQKTDWRDVAQALDRMAGPHDPIAYYPNTTWSGSNPAHWYVGLQRYMPSSSRPIMLLGPEPHPQAVQQLSACHAVWLAGPDPMADFPKYFPGFIPARHFGSAGVGSFLELINPSAAPATSPAPPPPR